MGARLGKLERYLSVSSLDLPKLTSEELLARHRKEIDNLGSNWEAYKNDPHTAADHRRSHGPQSVERFPMCRRFCQRPSSDPIRDCSIQAVNIRRTHRPA